MRIYNLIAKKRDGGTHSREEAVAAEEYRSGLAYGAERPAEDPLVYALVTKDGVERY